MTLAERIALAIKKSGKNQARVAEHFGIRPPAVSQWTQEGGTKPKGERLSQLADFLGVNVYWLLTGEGEMLAAPKPAASEPQPPAPDLFTPEVVDIPAPGTLPLSVPVYGTAMGGIGSEFDFNAGEVVDRVRRPPGLTNVPKAFALYVVGTSMEPRYREGELIYVHPGKPATPGCDVVVELHQQDEWGTHRALLKEYRGKTPSKLLLWQFNEAGPVEVPIEQVKQVLRVMTTAELMGV